MKNLLGGVALWATIIRSIAANNGGGTHLYQSFPGTLPGRLVLDAKMTGHALV